MKYYQTAEWQHMMAHAKKSLDSSCPLIEDEVLVAVNDELNKLRDENQAMKDILRDAIGLMRSTGVTSGWHQVANVAESLVNSELTTEKE